MAYQNREELEKRRRQLEREQRGEPKLLEVAKGAAKIASAVGVGYVGFKNKDILVNSIERVVGSQAVGRAGVTLSRQSDARTYRGVIPEAKNLTKAFSDTYGNMSPRRLVNTIMNRKERANDFQNRVLHRNNQSFNSKISTRIPRDIRQTTEQIDGFGRNDFMAQIETARKTLGEVLAKDEYKDAFGGQTSSVERVFQERPDLLRKNLNYGLKIKDGTEEGIPKELINLFSEYNHNDQKSINFNIPLSDKKAQARFLNEMYAVQKEVQESVRAQVISYSGPEKDHSTTYAGYRKLFDYTGVAGMREKHRPGQETFADKAFQGQGFRPITMGEAEKLYAERDPRTGILRRASKDSKDARRFQDLFSSAASPPGGDESPGIANKYVERGVRAGFDKDDLRSDIFSKHIKINDKTGEILNTYGPEELVNEGLDYLQDNYQVPFIRWNPLDATQRRYLDQQNHGLGSSIYTSGQVHVFGQDFFSTTEDINLRNKDSVGVLDKPYVQIGESIFDADISKQLEGLDDKKAFEYLESNLSSYQVADRQKIMDTSYGRMKRYTETLSGRTNREYENELGSKGIAKNMWEKAWGGPQEADSNWDTVKRGLSKFESATGPDNILNSHLQSLDNPDLAAAYLDDISYKLSSRIQPLSADGADALHNSFSDILNKYLNTSDGVISRYDFDTDEGLWSIAEKISQSDAVNLPGEKEALGRIEHSIHSKIQNIYTNYAENPNAYLKGERYLGDAGLFSEQIQNAMGETKEIKITKAQELKRLIEQYSISLYDQGMDSQVIDAKVKASNVLNPDSILNEVNALRSQSISSYFSSANQGIETVQDLTKQQIEFQATIDPARFGQTSRPSFRDGFQDALSRAEPWHAGGFAPKEERLLKNTYATPITKYEGLFSSIANAYESRPSSTGNLLDDALENSLHYGSQARDYLSQGFGWGGQQTSRSVVPWNIANNLDMRLQDLGLGLSNNLKGSPAQIMMNQFARRIALPYAIYQQGKWANDYLLGGRPTKAFAQMYANMHMDVAGLREATGINRFTEDIRNVAPWTDQLAETPLGIGIDFLTFGGLSNSMSPEELAYYYESGEDPVRSGRYWGVGSSGAYTGGRIDRYRPNWYRRTMSDYEYTDNMYGSPSEYFANSPIPTLSHPFAPVRHFLTDPYHWENKHALSRPYAKTGGYSSLQMIPVVGPAVDRVFSGIFKPQRTNPRLRSSHRAYQNQFGASEAGQYINMNTGGIADFRPSGSVAFIPDTYNVTYDPTEEHLRDEDGYLDEELLVSDSMRFETEGQRMQQALVNEAGPIGRTDRFGRLNPMNLLRPNRPSKEVVQARLAYQNNIVANQPMQRSPQVSNAGRVGSASNQPDLSRIQDPNALFGRHGQIEGVLDSLSSFGGMYGFVAKTASGFDIDDDRVRYLETSEQFTDYTRRFYDMELGGFPGDLSEIGRRYVDDDKRGNLYNPIRNTMPEFMPGSEYFIDFKHGDPFSKIADGEIRLPGAAYDTLYRTRKDKYGNYSAMDRYRILADTAPYSDQYRLARKEMALLNQNGLLDERQQQEYRDIREQVSSKNSKRRFYERSFGNAEINRETVTITDVLDQNTFLTEEYGSTPFKLAGVSLSQDDTEAIELVKQVIRPGEKVEVGIDADPNRRIRDDMLESSRVVVYSGRQNPFSSGGLRSGENLNYRLSQDPNVTVRDDGSATATHALNSQGMLTVGRLSERLVHDILPNIPVTNIMTDIFLPVRSPVEQYRNELYSKDFRDWASPIKGWVKPMLDRATSLNPVLSGLHGAGVGLLIGRKNRWNKAWGVGTAFALMSGMRTVRDAFNDSESPWMPKRREEEREVDEYFDKIKYIKYKGLYEQAKEIAKQKESIDLDAILRQEESRGQLNKGLETYLKSKKKSLTIAAKTNPHGAELAKQELAEVSEQLKGVDADRPSMPVGSYAALALRYKDEFESTIYGSQETFDYMQVYRGLPKRDKEFFASFQKASPEERQEIISLVPEYQKRTYKVLFGMEAGERESLEGYFMKYDIPDADWEGWAPEVSLDNIKVKVMKNEGIDLRQANYWEEDEMHAEQSGVSAINYKKPSLNPISGLINQAKLREALEGAGLEDVRIQMNTSRSDAAYFGVNLDIQRRREAEIEQGLREYMN